MRPVHRGASLMVAVAVTGAMAGCAASGAGPDASARATSPATSSPSAPAAAAGDPPAATQAPAAAPPQPQPWARPPADPSGRLAAGSDPSVLPGDVLIADKDNNRLLIVDPQGRVRWQFPRPGDLPAGQSFQVPDDAFFTPDGRRIVATEEDDQVVSVIDVATRRIVFRYGHPGQPGSDPGYLHNPDDALLLPDGNLLLADIKNCRLLVLPLDAHSPSTVLGRTTSRCLHNPPWRWGSPNGAFPMRNGHYLVTEINGHWVDEIDLSGRVYWTVQVPGVRYPSDSNEVAPGRYLTVDYSTPGQVVMFDRAGRVVWRFAPSGAEALSHPSLARPLPNGDVLVNDDYNQRIIVVDPSSNRIVWQYGHTGRAGNTQGWLNNPDGVDLVPPHALINQLAGNGAAH